MGTLAAADVKRLKLALAHNSAFSASGFGAGSSTSSGGNSVVFSAGVSSDSLSAVTFSNSNNVSFGLSNGVITAIANTVGGGAITNILFSAGSYSTYRSNITFANSNGVSFGQDTAGVITATVFTNYQSPGAYLTTAMASNRGSDFVQATAGFFGTNASGTIASDGISISVNPASAGGAGTGFTTATTAGTNIVGTLDTNGLSMGVPAYLTTAALSQDSSKYAGTSTGMTGGSVTLNTAGIAISLPSYLTTAMASNRGSDFVQASAGFFGTNASGTIASNAISISVNPVTAGAGTGFTTATTAGTNVVGTLNTNGLSMGVPAYLTTAALSQDSSKYAGTSTGMAGGSVTLDTAGISISLPAYLTTTSFPRLDQVLDGSSTRLFIQNTNNVGFRFQQVSTNATWDGAFLIEAGGLMSGDLLHIHHTSNDTNLRHLVHVEGDGAGDTGIHILLNTDTGQLPLWIQGATRGASIELSSQGAPFILNSNATNSVQYLNANFLQGRLSSDMAGTNGSIVGGSFTLNTSGATISLPAYLTTAQPAGNYAGTATSVVTTAGTDLSMALNTNGLTVAYPKWITTYVNDLTSGRAGTGFTSTTTAGVVITAALGTNGLSMAVPNYITTYVNDLTSGRAGTGFTSTSTAGVVITAALDTNGLSMAVPAYITTYVNDLTSGRAGTGFTTTSTAGTGLVGTLGTNGISMGVPAWITTGAASPATLSYWQNIWIWSTVSSTTFCQNNTFLVAPLTIQDYVSISYIRMPGTCLFSTVTLASSAVNNATGASSSWGWTGTWNAVLYTVGTGGSSQSLQYYTSTSVGLTWQGTVSQQSTSNASRMTLGQSFTFPCLGFSTSNSGVAYSTTATNGPFSTFGSFQSEKWLDIPFATLLSPGNYWIALNEKTATAGNLAWNFQASTYGMPQVNTSWANMGAVSSLSNCGWEIGNGRWTTNTGQTTSSIALSDITVVTDRIIPLIRFIRQA